MVKTFALATNIFLEDLAESHDLPFKHHAKDDIELLKSEQLRIMEQTSLVEIFKDLSGLELELKPNHFVSEKKFK